MVCHYCGYEQPLPKICPSCGSKYLGGFKAGTQKIEMLVQQRFPQARVMRMDFDTTQIRMLMRRFCMHLPIRRQIS